MSFLADLTARVADLEARLQNILQIAKVKVVHDTDEPDRPVEVRGVMLEKCALAHAASGTRTGRSTGCRRLGNRGWG